MATDWTTLPVPQYFEEIIRYKTISTQAEDGTERRRRIWASGREQRIFVIGYNALTKTNKDLLKNHHMDREGSYKTFTFNNPDDSVNYTCKFESDFLPCAFIGHNGTEALYRVPNFRLIEVW